LTPGDVVAFDYPLDHPVDLLINGKLLARGRIVEYARKRGFNMDAMCIRE
jgi:flagellar motor switch/type III secretory pathway protein FliN